MSGTENTSGAPANAASGTPAAGAPAAGSPEALAAAAAAALAAPASGDPLSIGDPAAKPAVAEPAAADKGAAIAYEPTGDVGLDMALDFVGNLGFGPNDPVIAAAAEGNFDLLKAKLAGMGDKAKGWERFVALAEKSFTDTKAKTTEKVAKDTAAIHAVVGGADEWKAISEWAGTNAEPEEKAAVNAALKAGGIQGKAMAAYLAGLYGRAQGTTIEPGKVTADAAGGKGDGAGPLTAKDYSTEVQKLRQTLGYDFESSQQYRNLQQRRIAGARSGK